MPYSGPNDSKIPSHVPKGKKAQWVKVWNSTYNSCVADGGSTKSCEAKAFKTANGVIKKRSEDMKNSLLGALNDLLVNMKSAFAVFQRRAISISSIGNAIFEQFYTEGAYLSDIYYDDGNLIATATMGGKLFRSAIAIDDNGDITIGDMQEVMIKFDPVNRATIDDSSADGKVLMLSLSATSVINKEGSIDSRALFDSMIDYMRRTKKRIPRTFYHRGVQFRSGDVIWMARDDNALLTLTEFDMDSELGRREVSARKADPSYWGDSIEFDPVGGAELWDVGDGITIPVYRAGIPVAVATVRSEYACSHYSNRYSLKQEEVKRMTLKDHEREDLIKLFGGNENEVDGWLKDNVDVVNRQIEESGQITRETEVPGETPAETPVVEGSEEATPEGGEEVVATEEPTEEQEGGASEEPLVLEFNDEMAQQTAAIVMESSIFTDFRDSVLSAVDEIKNSMATLGTTVQELQAASVARTKEINALKKADSEKQREWTNDLPRKAQRTVSFRPSQNAPVEDPSKRSMEDIASETLSKIQ
jgi:hypothetical protein